MSKAPNPKVFMALTAVALLAGGALCYWQYGNLSDVRGDVAKLRSEAKDEKDVRNDLVLAHQSFDETSAKLKHLEVGVSDLAYVPTLLKELEATGTKSGLVVLGVRPVVAPAKNNMVKEKAKGAEDAPKRKPYTELNIEVRCRGKYRSVMTFLSNLGMFPKIVAAKTVSMQPKTGRLEDQGAPTLDATFQLTSYVFGGSKDKKSDDDSTGEKTINLSASKRMLVQ